MNYKKTISCMIIVTALAIAAICPMGSAQATPVNPGQVQINPNVISMFKPVTFISPQNGELVKASQPYHIIFKTGALVTAVRVFVSIDGGQTWDYIKKVYVQPGENVVLWDVPNASTTNAQTKIQYFAGYGQNWWDGYEYSSFFTIK